MANHVQENRLAVAPRFLFNLLNKIRHSSLYSNAFYLMLNSAATSLLGFVFWNIMARFFPPAQVGIGSALVAASMLVGALANLGLGVGLVRYVPESGERAGRLINGAFTISGAAAAAGSLVYLAGAGRWSPALFFVRESVWLLVLFILFTIFVALSALTDQSLVAGRSARFVFWKNLIISLLKLPLPVFLFSRLDGYGIFAGTGTAVLAGVLVTWFFFLPLVYRGYLPRPAWAGDIMRQVLPYSFANYAANLLGGAPGFIYPLMVLNVLGPEMSAYFYIAWMMSMVLSIIPTGMAQSLLAEGSHEPQKLGSDGRRALALALMLSLPAVAAMVLLGGWLLHFFGPGYAAYGTGVMRCLVLAVLPQCVNVLFVTFNQVQKRVHLIIAQTGALAFFSLGLGYALLVRYGLNGLGAAYALANFLVAVVVAGPLLKRLREKEAAGPAGQRVS